MFKYIGNYNILSIDKKNKEIKKLYLGNNISYWNIRSLNAPEEPWEEYTVDLENYQLDLMDNWRLSTTLQDLDTNYITYESFSNWNINSGYANMKVTIPQGVQSLTVHYGSYAESSYDYTMLFKLDQQISLTTNYSSSNSYVQVHTNGKQSSQAPNLSYTYTISDTSKEHFFYVQYRKDSSVNSNQDRGYISFDKNDKRQWDGWRKLFHTYQVEEVSPYIYQFYDAQHYGYSLDKETIEYYDPITATTDVLSYVLINGEEEDTFKYNKHRWTKKYYEVILTTGEHILTDYYTFGEDKGEIPIIEPDVWHIALALNIPSDNYSCQIFNSNANNTVEVYNSDGELLTTTSTYTFSNAGIQLVFLRKLNSSFSSLFQFAETYPCIIGVYFNNNLPNYVGNNTYFRNLFDKGSHCIKYLYLNDQITYIDYAMFAHFSNLKARQTYNLPLSKTTNELVIPPQVNSIYDWGFSMWSETSSSNKSKVDRIYIWSDGTRDLTSVYGTKTQFCYTLYALSSNNSSTIKELYVPYGTSSNWRNNVIFTHQFICNNQWTIKEMPQGATWENTHKQDLVNWFLHIQEEYPTLT